MLSYKFKDDLAFGPVRDMEFRSLTFFLANLPFEDWKTKELQICELIITICDFADWHTSNAIAE
jgi:hypothetical protein